MLTLREAVAGAAAVVVLAGACSGSKRDVAAPPTSTTTTAAPTTTTEAPTTTTTARAKPSGPHALASFASCRSLLRHVKREAAKIVTPWGLPHSGVLVATAAVGRAESGTVTAGSSAGAVSSDSASPVSGPSFSGTNIQEAGLDEPDIVKTDGRRLVLVAERELKIVDLTRTTPVGVGTLALPQEDAVSSELLLAGDRVLLFSRVLRERESSVVRVISIAEPAKPSVVATMTIEGSYVSARLAAGVVRLVVAHQPKGPELVVPAHATGPVDEAALVASHRHTIRHSTIKDWLPTYRLERAGASPTSAPLVPCASVLHPKEFAGLAAVSVLTIDPADPKPDTVACVLGGGRIVYASPQNLYVATERWSTATPAVSGDVTRGGAPVLAPVTPTQIHQFAIPGREPAAYVASGEVAGSLLNQFSMSEHDGVLRAATTIRVADGSTDNVVHTLTAKAGRLVEVGKLAGLGHEGETIHSVRFIGTRGYVVTFRQTDPLYVIDLRDPARPKTLGELEVPGFSSYLHPLSDSALLGVGRGPDETGRQGLQVSLFDVGDPARPKRLANRVFNGHSMAQQDHHALLWWPATGMLALPFVDFGQDEHGHGAAGHAALVMPVDPTKGFGTHKLLGHGSPVLRVMVSNGRLLTIAADSILVSDATTLSERGRVVL